MGLGISASILYATIYQLLLTLPAELRRSGFRGHLQLVQLLLEPPIPGPGVKADCGR